MPEKSRERNFFIRSLLSVLSRGKIKGDPFHRAVFPMRIFHDSAVFPARLTGKYLVIIQ
jgi:hypothetical protein